MLLFIQCACSSSSRQPPRIAPTLRSNRDTHNSSCESVLNSPLRPRLQGGAEEPPNPMRLKSAQGCTCPTPAQAAAPADSQKCRPHRAPQKVKHAPSLQSAVGQLLVEAWASQGHPKGSGPTAPARVRCLRHRAHRERGSDFGWGSGVCVDGV